jgi:hypothetical protein
MALVSVLGVLVAGALLFFSGYRTTAATVFSQTSASSTLSQGLRLSVAINSATLSSDQPLNVTLDDYNTGSSATSLQSSPSWPVSSLLSTQACPSQPAPLNSEIFSGYYSASNISSASPLQTGIPLSPTQCPNRSFSSFEFQPSSDIVTASGSSAAPTGVTYRMTVSVQYYGYYVSKGIQTPANGTLPYNFVQFPSGTYTLAAGDEFGNLVLLCFTVG